MQCFQFLHLPMRSVSYTVCSILFYFPFFVFLYSLFSYTVCFLYSLFPELSFIRRRRHRFEDRWRYDLMIAGDTL